MAVAGPAVHRPDVEPEPARVRPGQHVPEHAARRPRDRVGPVRRRGLPRGLLARRRRAPDAGRGRPGAAGGRPPVDVRVRPPRAAPADDARDLGHERHAGRRVREPALAGFARVAPDRRRPRRRHHARFGRGGVAMGPVRAAAAARAPAARGHGPLSAGAVVRADWPDCTAAATASARQRALHADVGVEQILGTRTRWQVALFNRDERDVAFAVRPRAAQRRARWCPTTRRRATRTGSRATRGASRPSCSGAIPNGLSGWVAYAYERSRYTDPKTGESFDGDYDQRHTLNVYASLRLWSRATAIAKYRAGSNIPVRGLLLAHRASRTATGCRPSRSGPRATSGACPPTRASTCGSIRSSTSRRAGSRCSSNSST